MIMAVNVIWAMSYYSSRSSGISTASNAAGYQKTPPSSKYSLSGTTALLPSPPGHHGGLYFIPDIRYPELVSALLGINWLTLNFLKMFHRRKNPGLDLIGPMLVWVLSTFGNFKKQTEPTQNVFFFYFHQLFDSSSTSFLHLFILTFKHWPSNEWSRGWIIVVGHHYALAESPYSEHTSLSSSLAEGLLVYETFLIIHRLLSLGLNT